MAGNKPALATDRCFTTAGTEIARGAHVWDGILDNGPEGACTQEFPLHSTSRIVAGGPLRGGVYKCALQSVEDAIARRRVRLVDALGGRGRAAEGDLPDRGLRLRQPDVGRP